MFSVTEIFVLRKLLFSEWMTVCEIVCLIKSLMYGIILFIPHARICIHIQTKSVISFLFLFVLNLKVNSLCLMFGNCANLRPLQFQMCKPTSHCERSLLHWHKLSSVFFNFEYYYQIHFCFFPLCFYPLSHLQMFTVISS